MKRLFVRLNLILLAAPAYAQYFDGDFAAAQRCYYAEPVKWYRLAACHDTVPQIRSVPRIGVYDGLRAVQLLLWDGDRSQLITFDEPRLLRASLSVSR